jgi:hypothetical protein
MQIRTTDVTRTQSTLNRLDFFISTPPRRPTFGLMILPLCRVVGNGCRRTRENPVCKEAQLADGRTETPEDSANAVGSGWMPILPGV